ncbi:hypothetical protein J6590_023527 [Homalodisca vitripennis]|nr:hypothetical protein J6590_023527 [Homalodisca vitripennis]
MSISFDGFFLREGRGGEIPDPQQLEGRVNFLVRHGRNWSNCMNGEGLKENMSLKIPRNSRMFCYETCSGYHISDCNDRLIESSGPSRCPRSLPRITLWPARSLLDSALIVTLKWLPTITPWQARILLDSALLTLLAEEYTTLVTLPEDENGLAWSLLKSPEI